MKNFLIKHGQTIIFIIMFVTVFSFNVGYIYRKYKLVPATITNIEEEYYDRRTSDKIAVPHKTSYTETNFIVTAKYNGTEVTQTLDTVWGKTVGDTIDVFVERKPE